MNYFKNFPVTYYSGYPAINILVNANLSKLTRADRTAFYPYTKPQAMRADLLSNLYYDTPDYTWLVWFSNRTIDPYYSDMLSENDFYNYIVKKYKSYEIASRKIYFYRTNWITDTETITIDEYESLTGNNATLKKYYTTVTDNNFNIVEYRRIRTDITMNTNKIIQLTVEYTNGTGFTKGEELQVTASNYAFCSASESGSTTVMAQHVVGQINVDDVITGQESGTIATVVDVTTITTNIPDGTGGTANEAVYWEPITYLQYEEEQNMIKKECILIDKQYAAELNQNLYSILK